MRLSAALEAILSSIVQGSSNANGVSAELVPEYAKDEIRRRLGVPTLELTDVTLTLRFAVVGIKSGREMEIVVDPGILQANTPQNLQELQIRLLGKMRQVVDVMDSADPKKRVAQIE